MDIRFYHTGFCTHPECMVERSGSLKKTAFPAMAAHIRHSGGNLLFDTGYAPHFFAACRRFPEKLYAWVTPVTLNPHSLRSQLGEAAHDIDTVFLSHLHGDHIAGLRDFPQAQIILSRKAYRRYMDAADKRGVIKRFGEVRQGFLRDLLPDDLPARVKFIEDFPAAALDPAFYPFEQGYLIAPGLTAVELPGHAVGQYGLIAGELFLVADAAWRFANIRHNRRPHPLTALITDNYRAAQTTLDRLQALHRQSPGILLVPSHCDKTLRRLGMKGWQP